MQFSIIIPTFENFQYLKNTLDSIDTNSSYKHEIVIHINGEDIETEFYEGVIRCWAEVAIFKPKGTKFWFSIYLYCTLLFRHAAPPG